MSVRTVKIVLSFSNRTTVSETALEAIVKYKDLIMFIALNAQLTN